MNNRIMNGGYKRVVIGLTTIPSRVGFLGPVVAALADQTRVPDAIYVSVSKTFKRENIDYPVGEIASILRKNTGTLGKVLMLDRDYGPLTKLVGMWMHERDPDTLIITADDDQLYCARFVETMVKGAEKHRGSAVCLCGHTLGRPPFAWGFRCSRKDSNPMTRAMYLNPDSRVTVVSGWCGCAYPRGVMGDNLPERLERIMNGPDTTEHGGLRKLLRRHDDLYISSWMFLRNVRKYVISYECAHDDHELDYAMRDALSSNDGTRTVITMARHLREWWNLARKLQDMGLLEADVVPWQKSTVFIGSAAAAAIVLLASVAIFAAVRPSIIFQK
jgi:hypothetical protein